MLVAARSEVEGDPPSVRVTFVSSTLVSAAPEDISLAGTVETVKAPPAVSCFTNCPVPPVELKSVVPAGNVIVPDAVSGARIVRIPDVEPTSSSGDASLNVRPES